MASINTFAVTGVARNNATPVGQGTYYKIILDCYNAKVNRSDPIEIVGKADDMRHIPQGSFVAVQGSIGGKISDKGYVNVSLFAFTVEVITAAQAAAGSPVDDDYPPY